MTAYIRGVSSTFPGQVRNNAAWPENFGDRLSKQGDRLFNDIPESADRAAHITAQYLRAEASDPFLGVLERRVTEDSLTSVDAEVTAAELALQDAELDPSEVDLVLSYSVVPDRLTPASATRVADRVGATSALAFGMDAACATAIVQLQTAVAWINSGQARNVLLTQSHLLLRAFPMLHPAAPGLGDGATALVVSREGNLRIVETHSATHGEYYEAVTWVRGESEGDDTGWWKAGADFRVGSKNRADAKVLQRDTVTFAERTIRELLQKAHVDPERLELLCSVEPRGWVPRATLQLLNLSPDLASSVYPTRGHLGACGPIANLDFAIKQGRTVGTGLIALYGQGAGFTRAAALLEMDGSSRAN